MKSKTLAAAALVVSINERKRAERQAPAAAESAVQAAIAELAPRLDALRADLEAVRRSAESAGEDSARGMTALQASSTALAEKLEALALDTSRSLGGAVAELRAEAGDARAKLDQALRARIESGDHALREDAAESRAAWMSALERLAQRVAAVDALVEQLQARSAEQDAALDRAVRCALAEVSHPDVSSVARQAIAEMRDDLRGEPGAPGLRWRGAWRSDREYEQGDVVGHQGSSWVAVADSYGRRPYAASRYWDIVARAGEDGGGARPLAPATSPGETTVMRVRYPTGRTQVTVEAVKAAPSVQCYLTTFADADELEIESEASVSLAYTYIPAQQRLVVDTLPQFAGLLVLTF